MNDNEKILLTTDGRGKLEKEIALEKIKNDVVNDIINLIQTSYGNDGRKLKFFTKSARERVIFDIKNKYITNIKYFKKFNNKFLHG